jgi:hypothetical protein
MVVDGDFDEIAPAGLDPRTRILAVENLAEWVIDTIAVDGLISDIEMVLVPVRRIQDNTSKRGLPLLLFQ